MVINFATLTAADLPALKKVVAAANNTTTADTGTSSGTTLDPDAFKKLEKLLIDFKPTKSKLAIKKVEFGCPVELQNHVELFFDNINDIISSAEVDFECSVVPVEISLHNEKEVTLGKRTVIVIATRTYLVIPKQPLPSFEFSQYLEHKVYTMAEKEFGYKEPQQLENHHLQVFDIVCDRINIAAELLIKALKNPLRKIPGEIKEKLDRILDGLDLMKISLSSFNNIPEELIKQKEENERIRQQLEQERKEFEREKEHFNQTVEDYQELQIRIQKLERQNKELREKEINKKEISGFNQEYEEREDW